YMSSTHYRSLGLVAAAAIAASLLVASAVSAHAAVQVVTKATVTYPHFTTIQDAVNAAAPGDWVLLDVPVSPEAVFVPPPNLHLRGVDRNGVIVDGQHQVGNGIEVWKADGVWIENSPSATSTGRRWTAKTATRSGGTEGTGPVRSDCMAGTVA